MPLKRRLADLAAAVGHLPSRGAWARAALELCWALPLLVWIGHAGGLVRLQGPPDLTTLAGLAATLLVVPAFGEELLFRALVIPRERPGARWQALSTALFVAWHPLQAATVGPAWAGAFLDPWFIATVTVLGAVLARIYAATRSIWPCVAVHWLVVLVWKAFLGGPF